MKIALVYDVIYPYVKGGAEKRFYDIGRRLSDKHEVHFFGMKFWDGPDVIREGNVYLHGVCRPHRLYTGKKGQRSIKEALFFSLKLFRPLMKQDFDVLDCSSFPYFPLFTCKLVCVLKRKKMFATWHEVWGKDYWIKYLGYKGVFGYFVEKLSVLLPDEVISVSESTTKKLKNHFSSKKRIRTIFNGIDFDTIQKIKPSKQKSDVIYAGRLLEHKHVDVLIRAVKLVSEKRKVKCFIVGEGPERAKLKRLVKELKLEKNVKFFNFFKDQNNVFSLMKSSKVFVLPSTREGFGIVVIEANACGIPVITVNHEDNAAKDLIVNGKNGYVCDLDENEICDRIRRILNKKLMNRNCIHSTDSYDWDKIVIKIRQVLQG